MATPKSRSEALKIIPSRAKVNLLVFLAIATMPKIRPGTEIMVPYDKAIAANAERVERLLRKSPVEGVLNISIIIRINKAIQPATNDTMVNAFAAPPP